MQIFMSTVPSKLFYYITEISTEILLQFLSQLNDDKLLVSDLNQWNTQVANTYQLLNL